jgi:shikimate kinase
VKKKNNVVLIGMPGAGKSTLGVLLAKSLSLPFLDTDIHIQTQEGKPLKEIIRERGMDGFKKTEERHILALQCREHVIATGGSAVYSHRAMEHLRKQGTILFLDLSLEPLSRRIRNMDERGIVRGPDQGLDVLFRERKPLYQKYSDTRVCCDGKGHEQIVREIRTLLEGS